MRSDFHLNSLWEAVPEGPDGAARPRPRVDMCVVGAGIAGLSAAYHLARAGKQVVVLDDGPVAGGNTGRTTAHLSCVIDDRFTSLERIHGIAGSKLAAQSHAAAIDSIEDAVAREGIDCGFQRVDGYLFAPPDQRDFLEREAEAAGRAGLTVERLPRAPLPRFDTGPCLSFP